MPVDPAPDDVACLVSGTHWNPRAILGPHPAASGTVVRLWQPYAERVELLTAVSPTTAIPASRIHADGLFSAFIPEPPTTIRYKVRTYLSDDTVVEGVDPYAVPLQLTDFECHVFSEGTFYQAYDRLGAHVRTVEGIRGVHFVVWAPNAVRVSVVGDFNRWDGRCHLMTNRGATGLWELFLPDLPDGTLYKYEIRPRDQDTVLLKADPYAFASERRPLTASKVCDLSTFTWHDKAWMQARATREPLTSPMAIYEVHLGSWMRVPEDADRWLTYTELAERLIPYVTDMGYTHVELLPVTEHPFDGSWGYQTTGYFSATSRFGTPQEFMGFVDAAHQAGLGVILDWAPAHFPDDPHGLSQFDGTHLYDHADPRMGYHPDWHSRIFNYDRPEVRNFLLNSARFWLDRYHIDGLRVDAVASMLYLDYGRKPGEWVPNIHGGHENLGAVTFLQALNVLVHRDYPGAVTIAEESTSWPGVSRPTYTGGLGFTFKWNMGWMHDSLDYFQRDPIHRRFHHQQLTFGLLYAFSENFVLPLSHDEVVHGKRSLLSKLPGDPWQQHATLRALYGYQYGQPGKKMLFMGGEFGQRREWNHDVSLDWHLREEPLHEGLRRYVRDLNRLYQEEPAFWEADHDWAGFQWIDANSAECSVIAFIRKRRDSAEHLVCIGNFTPVPRQDYRVGVPACGWYRELVNSDAAVYGGSNMGNAGGVAASAIPCHGFPYSLSLTLPPLSMLILKVGAKF